MVKIRFNSSQIEVNVLAGTELLTTYRNDPELPLKFGCTNGECGVCAIKILEGEANLSPKTKQETKTLHNKKLNKEYRLACQCAVLGPVTIE